jgi:hypothetical protein
MKANIQMSGKLSLWQFVKANKSLNRSFVEKDKWEDFLSKIDELFIYNDSQIIYLKNQFLTRRK